MQGKILLSPFQGVEEVGAGRFGGTSGLYPEPPAQIIADPKLAKLAEHVDIITDVELFGDSLADDQRDILIPPGPFEMKIVNAEDFAKTFDDFRTAPQS
jgi:hypothetical protein